MTQRRWLYGLMGLLSLLGLIGIFTKERSFLFFFAFLVDFEYFFLKSDEMLEDYMNRSASRAFFCVMIATAAVTLLCFFLRGQIAGGSLLTGFAAGWAVSVTVYAVSTAYYGIRERWDLASDQK